jgi:hypothetical protein
MPDESLEARVRRLEAGLKDLQLEVSELRATVLGPASPFNLVLASLEDQRKELRGEFATIRGQLDGHGRLLVLIAAKVGVPANPQDPDARG